MGTMLAMMMIVGAPSHHQPSYVEVHTAAVVRSFLIFKSDKGVEREQNAVGEARAHDALMLGGRAPSMQSGAMGSMVMGAAVVLAAHAPARMRAVVDGPVHVGPALFEGGGMGAGVGGRF
ncbi:MAG TPA: hypothetical protein VN947_13075 [Polyangia bacterium]|nr:hypothetical protein [Polyangia bacterium]